MGTILCASLLWFCYILCSFDVLMCFFIIMLSFYLIACIPLSHCKKRIGKCNGMMTQYQITITLCAMKYDCLSDVANIICKYFLLVTSITEFRLSKFIWTHKHVFFNNYLLKSSGCSQNKETMSICV